MNKLLTAIIAAAALNITGCSTIVNGTKAQTLRITSNVPAQVHYDSKVQCTTPCTISLKKNSPAVWLSSKGYKNKFHLIRLEHQNAQEGNFLLAPLGVAGTGRVIDALTGANMKYKNEDLHIVLEKEKA